MEQIDRVDGHKDIGGIFVFGVVELLDRFDRKLKQFVLPVFEVFLRPVAVCLSNVDHTVGAKLVDDPFDRFV